MEKAYETLEEISRDEKIIGLYDAEKVEQKVINTKIEGARREGIETGIQQEKIKIAKSMLLKNMRIEDIMDITGLTKDQIVSLKEN
ncbi:hypothetical protein EGP64_03470 [bacterium]|nr:hypothetical protein [bacterium]